MSRPIFPFLSNQKTSKSKLAKMSTRSIVEALEQRRLLSGSVTISNGVVTVTGTTSSDTIAGGTNPNNTNQYYFLVQTSGQATAEQIYDKSQVTGVNVLADPNGSTPNGANNDLINFSGTNFGFAIAINGGMGSDTIEGQLGPNQIISASGSVRNLLLGGPGDDTVEGLGSSETIRSGGGSDTLQATGGNNVIAGGRTGSQCIAGTGHDTLRAGRGNSTLYSNGGGDLLVGGFGNDFLQNRGSGADTMIGGSGQSTLIGGTGNDVLDAGWDDYLIFQGASGLPANQAAMSVTGGSGSDTLISSTGPSHLTSTTGGNVWSVNNPQAVLSGQSGQIVAQNDTISSITQSSEINLIIQQSNGGVTRQIQIPTGAGSAPSGISVARSIDANGNIVFQSNAPRTFSLSDFFNHWGVVFNSVGIGQFQATSGSGHSIAMTVNGVTNNNFQNYAVQNGDHIVITFTQ